MSLGDRLARAHSRASRRTLFVLIGARRIECGVMSGTSWLQDGVVAVPIETAEAPESLQAALGTALQQLERQLPEVSANELRVVVADSWLSICGVPWHSSLKQVSSANAYARSHLLAAGFEIEPFDTLRLDDGPFGVPHLAAVYPAALLDALQRLSESLRAQLTSVLPLSVAAWGVAHRMGQDRTPALAVRDAGLTLVVRGLDADSRWPNEVTARLDDGHTAQLAPQLSAIWRRLCLREPHLMEIGNVGVLDLTAANESVGQLNAPFVAIAWPSRPSTARVGPGLELAARAQQLRHPLDAVRARAPATMRRAIPLAAISIVAGTLVLDTMQTRAAVNSLAAEVAASASGSGQLPRQSAPLSREELARAHAINAAIRDLNLPIAEILRALEPPRDIRVAVLSVETTTGDAELQGGRIKVVAEARTGPEMARYVGFLGERRPFMEAYLLRHEIDEASADRRYRFTVDARWSE